MEVRGNGPTNAKIMLVQDCPQYQDLHEHSPFSGNKGKELNRMLAEAGIMRSECFTTSLVRSMIPGARLESVVAMAKNQITPAHKPFHDKMVLEPFSVGAAQLIREIDLVKPNVIVAFGNGALFALTGKWGLKSWRGSILKFTTPSGHTCAVIATYPPDYVLAVWKDRSIAVHDLRTAAGLRHTGYVAPPEYDFLVRPSFSEVIKRLRILHAEADKGSLKLSVDIETRGGHIACTGIAWSKLSAICIPHLVSGNNNYWLEHEEAFIVWLMYQLFTHPNVEVIGQNFLYDSQYFYRHFHFIPRLKRDTMITQHCLFANAPKGLDYLSSVYTSHHVYWKDESKNWDPKVGEDQLWTYNCKDCVITYEVDEEQQKAIASFVASGWTQLPSVVDFQQELFYPVLQTMIDGIATNNDLKSSLAEQLRAAIAEREAWLEYVIGRKINIKSPKQMCDFFYRELAQKEIKSRKTGSVTCDDAALERIAEREPLLLPVRKVIGELRSLGVFLSTFIEAPLDTDGRMRCSFNITGTETYRFSSSENAFGSGMNLQNIPKGEDEDPSFSLPNVREMFVPDEGYEFFDIDLDSADLRIVVAESNCTEMQQMLDEGLKPYVEVAKEYYHDPSITKHHSSYKLFKALCHGTHYLGTPPGLASRIGLMVSEVERIQNWYFGKFPQIKQWQEDFKNQVVGRRYVENIFGYRTYIFDRIEGTIFNQCIAWLPQSTVACLINRGYRNLYRTEKDIQVLLQVHDSLAGQYSTSLRDSAQRRIIEACSIELPYPKPIVIPVGIKTSKVSWGHCG